MGHNTTWIGYRKLGDDNGENSALTDGCGTLKKINYLTSLTG